MSKVNECPLDASDLNPSNASPQGSGKGNPADPDPPGNNAQNEPTAQEASASQRAKSHG